MQALEKTRTRFWKFESQDLRNCDLISDLVASICCECDVDRSRVHTLELVIAEVVNNAIDHGVLGLDSSIKKNPEGFEEYFICRAARLAELRSGFVSVLVEQLSADIIAISVEDSGAGFDFPLEIQTLQPENLMQAYGRGLMIIRHLCESMMHVGRGNCVLLQFRISAE